MICGGARRGYPPLHPEFLSLLRQRKKPKKGGPALRSPPACGWGCPCLRPRQGSGRNSLRSLRSLRSNSLPGSVIDARLRAHPCLGRKPGGAEGQIQLSARCLQSAARSSAVGFGCWGSAPFAPPALAPRQGRVPQARHPSSSARLFDRNERSECREFLAGPCLGVRAGNPQPQAGGERIRGLIFWFLLDQAKRNSSAGTRPGGLHRKRPRSPAKEESKTGETPSLPL